ncbi:hypothetical protein [Hydrogenophaga sp. NFH-34]|nr:hypothetical protein [Hydrogenophaga sp. NFH-34]
MTAASALPPIAHEDNASRGAFYLEQGGRRLAEMTYSRTNDLNRPGF